MLSNSFHFHNNKLSLFLLPKFPAGKRRMKILQQNIALADSRQKIYLIYSYGNRFSNFFNLPSRGLCSYGDVILEFDSIHNGLNQSCFTHFLMIFSFLVIFFIFSSTQPFQNYFHQLVRKVILIAQNPQNLY
jgi:hypothetical protein